MTGNSYDLLKQLKDKKIWTLILLEGNCRVLRVLPDDSFIRMETMRDGSCSFQFIERESMSEAEIANALIIKGSSFGVEEQDALTVLTRDIDVNEHIIHFNAYENRLAIKHFRFKLNTKLKYRISYDTITGEFMFKFDSNYENVGHFFSNYMLDYFLAIASDEARTTLASENAEMLASIQPFLANIGFEEVMKDNRRRFKTQTFGDRYLWDVLFRHLYLISIRPQIIMHILQGDAELAYSLIFDVDTISFYETCEDFKKESGTHR